MRPRTQQEVLPRLSGLRRGGGAGGRGAAEPPPLGSRGWRGRGRWRSGRGCRETTHVGRTRLARRADRGTSQRGPFFSLSPPSSVPSVLSVVFLFPSPVFE